MTRGDIAEGTHRQSQSSEISRPAGSRSLLKRPTGDDGDKFPPGLGALLMQNWKASRRKLAPLYQLLMCSWSGAPKEAEPKFPVVLLDVHTPYSAFRVS